MMQYRPLGRTGLSLSALTFGTAGVRDGQEAARALDIAVGAGVNAVELAADDEAAVALVAGRRELHPLVRLTPAVPMPLPMPHLSAGAAYPGAAIRRQVEGLLRRLDVEQLGMVQLHAWCPEWLEEGDWLQTAQALKREGKVAGIGVSLFDHDVDAAATAVASGAIDTVQVMVNLFDQGAAPRLLPFCHRHGVGVIARSPLFYGALSGRVFGADFPPDDWRREYFTADHLAETRERVARIGAGGTAALALRFALATPGVATVAVGMLTPEHVAANLRALAAPMGTDEFAAMGKHRWLC